MCNVSCLRHSPSRVEAKKIDSMRISGAFLSFLCFATSPATRLQASPRLQQSGRSALEPRYSYNIKPNLREELHNVAVSWAETLLQPNWKMWKQLQGLSAKEFGTYKQLGKDCEDLQRHDPEQNGPLMVYCTCFLTYCIWCAALAPGLFLGKGSKPWTIHTTWPHRVTTMYNGLQSASSEPETVMRLAPNLFSDAWVRDSTKNAGLLWRQSQGVMSRTFVEGYMESALACAFLFSKLTHALCWLPSGTTLVIAF